MKARAPETNVSAYRLGCLDDRGMGKALLELPLKWRVVSNCMPAHVHNAFTRGQSTCKNLHESDNSQHANIKPINMLMLW